VVFEREDIDGAAFLGELRRTVSDDALLMEYLQVTTVRRTRIVPIGGSIRESVERQVRWTKILWTHDPGPISVVILLLVGVLAGAVLFPLYAAVVLAAFHLAINEVLGVRRWTALLTYPSVFAFVLLIPYALARRTFVWGNRRYRWRSKFDVEIVK
jgi:hypothetical protein